MPIEIFTRTGKLIRTGNKNYNYLSVLVEKENGKVKCLMFTDFEIAKAEARADANPSDQPKRSLISSLLD